VKGEVASVQPASPSFDSILEAAQRAIAEKGPGPLTMSAVAVAAGISRPTLYRWFPTKADLLEAVAARAEHRFDVGLQAVIDSHRVPKRRLDAALRYLMTYLDNSLMSDPISVDPAFVLGSLARSIGPHIKSLARQLDDALLEVPAVRAGNLSREQAAELFLRLAYSHYLVPNADADALLATMRDFAGIPSRRARVLTG
jgi:AcrR family transcriptional regulator